MKLISVAIFSFAIALLALALGLETPPFLSAISAAPEVEVEVQPPVDAEPAAPRHMDSHSREALDAARRQLASALQARTEAEATRDAARAHVAAAAEAFEASMIELTEAEDALEAAGSNKRSRRVKNTTRIVKRAREATVGAEARLREAREILHQAEAAYDQSQASMSQARAALQAVTARASALPSLFEAV